MQKNLWSLGLGIALTSILSAHDALAEPVTLNQANTSWILTSTALVLFMTLPGLALFYGGLVRIRNVLSILMQCFSIACLVSTIWFLFAYSLAFGNGDSLQAFWGGWDKVFLIGVSPTSLTGDIPETVFVMFQMTFAIITPALVIGGFAERARFSAVLWFSSLWVIFIYAPLCHWVWGGGWLAQLGFMDFAGGSVVHINAGIAALIAALVIGNRRGFPKTPMMPHNMTMVFTGASMLWVGWFGFNGGSALAANGNAGMAILVTHLGAATGSLAWMTMEWVRHGKASILGIVTGMVAGLGTITPASGFVGPAGAAFIGLLAGWVCYWFTQLIRQRLKIDDSLDVSPVHGVGGILGTILTGVFAAPMLGGTGLASGGSMLHQVGVQALGVIATLAWSGTLTFIILKIVDATVGLRADRDQETEGLDLAFHDEKGYNLDTGSF
ncbi:MAG: ammonium transporter [Magnetococcales bacterium]|nr:ammonium transporter [Magnetococcales bacterium]MBF0148514.1 ammonium transporter [Magnetococcales bacterium]MBF0172640.1 ammonium transporter [Magnetococcales bacterium]MBF0346514.1 ammonium transporter [Magnetococcales bacterium]MBF0629795.1 ammonium transporter [Magnetococcales bacterium]